MRVPAAVLLDVYETVLTCDFERHFHGLAEAAGVTWDTWSPALEQLVPDLVRGRMTIVEAFRRTLTTCGGDPARAEQLAQRDIELIVACTTLYPDVLPSIARWRSLGVRVALVSNCVANTGPLLATLGLSAAVDATVLSCDVGSIKPEPAMYRAALAAVGVDAHDAVFVDDQPAFCDGAATLGMRAVRIDRTGTTSGASGPHGTLRSLEDLDTDGGNLHSDWENA